MESSNLDHPVRLAAFAFLTEQTRIHGEVLSYTILHEGFIFEGRCAPPLGPPLDSFRSGS